MYPLVQQHNGGIQHRRGQSQQNARSLAAPEGSALQYAGQAHHAAQRRRHAQALFQRQRLMGHHGGEQNHQNGRQIVAQRGHRHRGITIGLEQQDPVEAQGAAGQEQIRQIFSNDTAVKARAPNPHQHQQKQRPDDTPAQGDDAAGQADVLHQQADGAENHHCSHKFAFFRLAVHTAAPACQTDVPIIMHPRSAVNEKKRGAAIRQLPVFRSSINCGSDRKYRHNPTIFPNWHGCWDR